ncbi:hypothetical protein BHE74_00021211 [Ensete ventricosum]|nr:hypothetical protein BHE74_00021211 [Ensete ventricosum]
MANDDRNRFSVVIKGNNRYLMIPPGSGRSAYWSVGGPVRTARYEKSCLVKTMKKKKKRKAWWRNDKEEGRGRKKDMQWKNGRKNKRMKETKRCKEE